MLNAKHYSHSVLVCSQLMDMTDSAIMRYHYVVSVVVIKVTKMKKIFVSYSLYNYSWSSLNTSKSPLKQTQVYIFCLVSDAHRRDKTEESKDTEEKEERMDPSSCQVAGEH